ncbi:MAG TPA: FixH family protein [Steroidobacteraceae bacterium]|nr:FixH family protein [Steroidobacteraceae bacterium]
MQADAVDSPFRSNPVFWLMWLLPTAAVVAGLATLFIALRSADRALPASYHWEGEQLDRDFARARNAAAHGVAVSFAIQADAGQCYAVLHHAPDDPGSLTLLFANSADAGLDRVIRLQRTSAGHYAGECAAPPAGRWRVSLDGGQWAIRTQVSGAIAAFELRARDPAGGA